MKYNKEQAIERLEKIIEKTLYIHSNYSSEEISKKLYDNYKYIIFTNYIKNGWCLNNGKNIDNFLDFFGLNISSKDKLNFFYHHFIYLDFFELVGNDIISKYKTRDFFESEIYLKLDEKDLENVYIIPSKKITNIEFWQHFYKGYIEDFFDSVYYTYYDNDLIDCRYKYDKKIIMNTLSYLYSVLGDEFEINQKMFNKKQEISFMEFIISFTYVGFIEITEIGLFHIDNITYGIKILPKFKKILDEIEEKRELILDKVFDEKYNEIKIRKQNGEVSFIEGEINIYGDDTKFIELKKKYPFSKIETEVHNGKSNKYKIKEKIKLKKQ